jgi:hypothetical protein
MCGYGGWIWMQAAPVAAVQAASGVIAFIQGKRMNR